MLSFPQQKWQVVRTNILKKVPRSEVDLITDRLYLGSWIAAGNKDLLAELGITHVVSMLEIEPGIPDIIDKTNKLHIRINDTPDSNILRHLEETTNFIKSAMEVDENNKVLVSSRFAVDRSALSDRQPRFIV